MIARIECLIIIQRITRSTRVPETTFFRFFFNDTATTEIYTLSLHDALPIFYRGHPVELYRCVDARVFNQVSRALRRAIEDARPDRKSTRLNSSHANISYAVFCLKKKKTSLNASHSNISYAVFCLKTHCTIPR